MRSHGRVVVALISNKLHTTIIRQMSSCLPITKAANQQPEATRRVQARQRLVLHLK
jgi:hypothetical protein